MDKPAAAVVFLHGSGDTGAGIRSWVKELGFVKATEAAGVLLETPSAIPRPYKLAGGQISSVWFDRYDLPPTAREHTESIEASCAQIEAVVSKIVASGVPAEKVAVGGFSMGGGIALQWAFRTSHKVGAVFAMSAYLNDGAAVYKKIPQRAAGELPPVFIRHGAADGFIRTEWGAHTAAQLSKLGVDVNFDTVPGLVHQLDPREINELREFLSTRLGVRL
mmetsp:Transcript_20232/g.60118  ORF Transcript_20232/g.60118 Transcript_20232/m.60118 type:complete len:220 (+) Transcript_20232:152-811(+)